MRKNTESSDDLPTFFANKHMTGNNQSNRHYQDRYLYWHEYTVPRYEERRVNTVYLLI